MNDIAAQTLPWIALVAILLAVAAAVAVLAARSLFSACVGLAAMCACAAGALLGLGAGDGALAVGLLGGLAPVLLLGGVLLSSRAVKPRTRGLPWLSIGAAAAAAAAILWAAPSLDLQQQPIAPPRAGASPALGALVFIAAAACAALLGYGERGVLGSKSRDA